MQDRETEIKLQKILHELKKVIPIKPLYYCKISANKEKLEAEK
jgi:hypothetical protein